VGSRYNVSESRALALGGLGARGITSPAFSVVGNHVHRGRIGSCQVEECEDAVARASPKPPPQRLVGPRTSAPGSVCVQSSVMRLRRRPSI
jgi:hypothetical protein